MVETQNNLIENQQDIKVDDAKKIDLTSTMDVIQEFDLSEQKAIENFKNMMDITEDMASIKKDVEWIQKIEHTLNQPTKYRSDLDEIVNSINTQYGIMNRFVSNTTLQTNYNDIVAGVKNKEKVKELIDSVNANKAQFIEAFHVAKEWLINVMDMSTLVITQAELEKTKTENEVLKKELDLAKLDNERLRCEQEEMIDSLNDLNEQKNIVEGKLKDCINEKNKMEETINSLKEKQKRLETKVKDLKNKNRYLEEDVDYMYNNGRYL